MSCTTVADVYQEIWSYLKCWNSGIAAWPWPPAASCGNFRISSRVCRRRINIWVWTWRHVLQFEDHLKKAKRCETHRAQAKEMFYPSTNLPPIESLCISYLSISKPQISIISLKDDLCLIFRIPRLVKNKFFSKKEGPEVFLNQHCFVLASKWTRQRWRTLSVVRSASLCLEKIEQV